MKPIQTAALIAAGVFAYSLFSKASAGNALVWFPKGIRAITFSGGSPVIELNLGVGNPTNQSFTLKALAGNLFTNGTYIGYISTYNSITMQPASEAIIPIKIKLSPLGIVSELLDDIQSGGWKQKLALEMRANVDNLVIPVKLNYTIG